MPSFQISLRYSDFARAMIRIESRNYGEKEEKSYIAERRSDAPSPFPHTCWASAQSDVQSEHEVDWN